MDNAMNRFRPASEAISPKRRKSSRVPAQAIALLGSLDGENTRVVIGDVSAHGCSVRCAATWLRTGRFVSIGLDDAPPLRAIVRWVRDETAGLEFLRPIPLECAEWHALMR